MAMWSVEYEGDAFERFLTALPPYEQAVLIAAIENVLAVYGIDICASEWGKSATESTRDGDEGVQIDALCAEALNWNLEAHMTRTFDDLARRTKADWDHDTRAAHEAEAGAFAAEVAERAALGAALLEARTARSLTQQALAELTGVQQAEISRIERGTGNPTAATLVRLTRALGQRVVLVPAGH